MSLAIKYNDILMNIVVLLRYKKFYNHCNSDFRGRVYPTGLFHYLDPIVRNFLMFSRDENLYTNKLEDSLKKTTEDLLFKQLDAYIDTS